MKKKYKPTRLPGQMPPTEGALINEQKKCEEIQTMYGILRAIFEQQCIQLGIQEVALVEYTEGGIQPTVKPRSFPESQTDQRHKFMESRLVDFHKMTAREGGSLVTNAIKALVDQVEMLQDMIRVADTPPPPEPSPVLGADGLPVTSAKNSLASEEPKA